MQELDESFTEARYLENVTIGAGVKGMNGYLGIALSVYLKHINLNSLVEKKQFLHYEEQRDFHRDSGYIWPTITKLAAGAFSKWLASIEKYISDE